MTKKKGKVKEKIKIFLVILFESKNTSKFKKLHSSLISKY